MEIRNDGIWQRERERRYLEKDGEKDKTGKK